MSSNSVSTATSKPQPQNVAPAVQEFNIRVPKDSRKKYNVMRFNNVLKVDFKDWKQVKMERENNMKDFKGIEEEIPKFGAGSEFGRESREEARRKKFGITSKKYNPDDQPWILKANGKAGKKFKGIREGGIAENTAYYVFTHAPDGAIEAFRLQEWYNFQPIQRYKALSAEEAEQEFSKRNRTINYFSLMMRKRVRNDEEGALDGELLEVEKSKRSSKKEKDLKISEMDEWMDSDDDDDDESEHERKSNDSDDDGKKNKTKNDLKKKKKKKASDDEAFEESDDGDEEGRECDYISDSSASEDELETEKEMKSVAEEDALRKLLASDESSDEDEDGEKKNESDKNEDEDGKDKDDKDKGGKGSEKKKDGKKSKKKDGSESSDVDETSGTDINKDKNNKKSTTKQTSRSGTPVPSNPAISDSQKRPLSSPDTMPAKKPKIENSYSSYIPGSNESGITEDAVRRYLMRKPMTTTELLQKFKSKKTGLSSEQIVTVMTKILKSINPASQKIKGKMYFSIKAQPH